MSVTTLRITQPQSADGHGTASTATADGSLLLSKADMAREFRTSCKTIDRMDSSGKLPRPFYLSGRKRWRRSEILDWLAAGAPRRGDWERQKAALRK